MHVVRTQCSLITLGSSRSNMLANLTPLNFLLAANCSPCHEGITTVLLLFVVWRALKGITWLAPCRHMHSKVTARGLFFFPFRVGLGNPFCEKKFAFLITSFVGSAVLDRHGKTQPLISSFSCFVFLFFFCKALLAHYTIRSSRKETVSTRHKLTLRRNVAVWRTASVTI